MFDIDPDEEAKAIEQESEDRGGKELSVLNGAQAQSMANFLQILGEGTIAPDTVIQALVMSFGLSMDDAKAIVSPMIGYKKLSGDAEE